MKHAHKVKIVGRKIDLYAETDVAATIRRVRKQQEAVAREKEAEARETAKVVRPMAQRKAA